MTDDLPHRRVLEGKVLLPPEYDQRRSPRMPSETPFGLGFLGEAKFDAIRRVIEARERAIRAVTAHVDAEASVDEALRRRAIGLDRLRNVGNELEQIREAEEELAALSKLKRRLERVQLEEQIEVAEARRRAVGAAPTTPAAKSDPYEQFVGTLGRIPGVVASARRAKDDIIQAAGGEAGLSPEDQDLIAAIDQMLQEFIAAQGERARP
jgi:hypothetical protein